MSVSTDHLAGIPMPEDPKQPRPLCGFDLVASLALGLLLGWAFGMISGYQEAVEDVEPLFRIAQQHQQHRRAGVDPIDCPFRMSALSSIEGP